MNAKAEPSPSVICATIASASSAQTTQNAMQENAPNHLMQKTTEICAHAKTSLDVPGLTMSALHAIAIV